MALPTTMVLLVFCSLQKGVAVGMVACLADEKSCHEASRDDTVSLMSLPVDQDDMFASMVPVKGTSALQRRTTITRSLQPSETPSLSEDEPKPVKGTMAIQAKVGTTMSVFAEEEDDEQPSGGSALSDMERYAVPVNSFRDSVQSNSLLHAKSAVSRSTPPHEADVFAKPVKANSGIQKRMTVRHRQVVTEDDPSEVEEPKIEVVKGNLASKAKPVVSEELPAHGASSPEDEWELYAKPIKSAWR
eukprot:TRINITY_DN20724_c0_g1_i1.p1 TRINITY_DN20724_c0_g1~~TRINITY_DN20724_c0_g1_i1.p1  ORF type:complete len:245 (-),score=53.47 TRINITY_DN20724_c0_g1_i1:71-805(-)